MGTLVYGDHARFQVDDGLLPFLRVVVMNKLRRGEPFMLTLPTNDGSGSRYSLWVSPSVPLVFAGNGEIPARTENPREMIDQLMHDASGPDGLDLHAYL